MHFYSFLISAISNIFNINIIFKLFNAHKKQKQKQNKTKQKPVALFRINNQLTKKHNIDTKNFDFIKKHPQRYIIFNGLKGTSGFS